MSKKHYILAKVSYRIKKISFEWKIEEIIIPDDIRKDNDSRTDYCDDFIQDKYGKGHEINVREFKRVRRGSRGSKV